MTVTTQPTGKPLLGVAAVAGLVAVVVLDLLLAARRWPIPVEAAIDEPAHLLTAWLLLVAAGARHGRLLTWALLGSVLLDLDHLPMYAGADVTADGGRPVTHSLTTVLILLLAARAWRNGRTPLVGVALGVLLHMARDLASRPGVPWLWPLVRDSAEVPHSLYLGLLVLATTVICVRVLLRRGDGTLAPPPGRSARGSGQD